MSFLSKLMIRGIFSLISYAIMFMIFKNQFGGMLGAFGFHLDSIGDVFAVLRQAQDGFRMLNDMQGQLGELSSLMSGLGN